MGTMKDWIMGIEAEVDKMIREHSGDSRFAGVYEWRNGIAYAYITATVQTKAGTFCAQFWKRRNVVKIHKESQPGIFVPVASQTI
jgi:hypothetical protein